jgi:hypothetical protein
VAVPAGPGDGGRAMMAARAIAAAAITVAPLLAWGDGATTPDCLPTAPASSAPPGQPSAQRSLPVTQSLKIVPDDADGAVRLSLPTEEDRAAWRRSGFRLALGVLYGQLQGAGEVPDLTLKGVVIRPGIRIDPEWSVYLPLQYASTSKSGGRFAAAVEPTWHITPSFAVGFGLGYAGLIGISPYDPTLPAQGPETALGQIDQPYTFPDAKKPIQGCDGVGVTALARAELGYVLGPRSRTHVALEALGQRTGCEENGGGRDAFTGANNKFRQWWGHTGVTLSWGIEWR